MGPRFCFNDLGDACEESFLCYYEVSIMIPETQANAKAVYILEKCYIYVTFYVALRWRYPAFVWSCFLVQLNFGWILTDIAILKDIA